MPRIWHENKTVEWRTNAEDEAVSRVGLQELLDNNPGYTPVLIVEDAAGKETTYTSLDAPKRRGSAAAAEVTNPVVIDEEPPDPDYYEDEDNKDQG